MTDTRSEAVERLACDMQKNMPWGRGAATLRALAAERDRALEWRDHDRDRALAAEARAEAAEKREKALLDSNQVQRDATVENVALRAQLKAAEDKVKALIEAGNRMANSIKSNYYDPGAATAWDVTLQEKPHDTTT